MKSIQFKFNRNSFLSLLKQTGFTKHKRYTKSKMLLYNRKL